MHPRRRPKPRPETEGPKIVVPGPGNTPPPENVKEMRVMRSYIEYDTAMGDHEAPDQETPARANWTMIWGIVVVAAISVGFWAGVWVLVKHYWK